LARLGSAASERINWKRYFLRTVAQRQRADQREQCSWWQRLVSYGNMSGAWFLAARSLRHYI